MVRKKQTTPYFHLRSNRHSRSTRLHITTGLSLLPVILRTEWNSKAVDLYRFFFPSTLFHAMLSISISFCINFLYISTECQLRSYFWFHISPTLHCQKKIALLYGTFCSVSVWHKYRVKYLGRDGFILARFHALKYALFTLKKR